MDIKSKINDKIVSLLIIELSYRIILSMVLAWSLFIILNLSEDIIGIKFYLACFFILNLFMGKIQEY